MDLKHFSHSHNLRFHQLPQGTDINCSGCKLPALGNAYMCWPCQFFLHEQCFQASRSLIHDSHPSHPLALVPYPTYPSGSFFCNSCSLVGTGFCYSCPHCEFDLHIHCASYIPETANVPHPYNQIPNFHTQYGTPDILAHQSYTNNPTQHYHQQNDSVPCAAGVKHFSHHHPLHLAEIQGENPVDCFGCERKMSGSAFICTETSCKFQLHQSCFGLPPKLHHKSHPEHPLTLLTSPAYIENGGFTCNACFSKGTAFSYHCPTCSYDLHVDCAFLPESVNREDHPHSLDLLYSLPRMFEKFKVEDVDVSCDVCQGMVDFQRCWFYYCQICDYVTHLDCVAAEACPKEEKPSEEDLLAAVQLEIQMLQLRSRLSKLNADYTTMSCAESIHQMGKIG